MIHNPVYAVVTGVVLYCSNAVCLVHFYIMYFYGLFHSLLTFWQTLRSMESMHSCMH